MVERNSPLPTPRRRAPVPKGETASSATTAARKEANQRHMRGQEEGEGGVQGVGASNVPGLQLRHNVPKSDEHRRQRLPLHQERWDNGTPS